mmetsp:Transcript_5908/g.14998  ORF Transcript_5908/g.14998 Transcript_5908/m.14998 type:complete len:210 (+) Transcript_5908:538-1167(+)
MWSMLMCEKVLPNSAKGCERRRRQPPGGARKLASIRPWNLLKNLRDAFNSGLPLCRSGCSASAHLLTKVLSDTKRSVICWLRWLSWLKVLTSSSPSLPRALSPSPLSHSTRSNLDGKTNDSPPLTVTSSKSPPSNLSFFPSSHLLAAWCCCFRFTYVISFTSSSVTISPRLRTRFLTSTPPFSFAHSTPLSQSISSVPLGILTFAPRLT